MKYTFAELQGQFSKLQEAKQPKLFAAQIAHRLGLCDKNGRGYQDKNGLPCLSKERQDRPEDYNLPALTEAMLGRDWANKIGLSETAGQAMPVRRWLSESNAAPIGPSFFLTVNAWTNVIGALVQAALLEGYEAADYDIRNLFPTIPATIWEGEKLIDVLGPGQPADEIAPGEPHGDMPMSMMWVQAATLRKYGGKLLVTKESAWADITGGQVIQKARTMGEMVAYRENELALDVICGTTNNFAMAFGQQTAATGYNTYGATINGRALGNSFVNPLTDWTSLQNIDNVVSKMRHPVYPAVPIKVRTNLLVVPFPLGTLATQLNTADNFMMGTQGQAPLAQIASSTFPTGQTTYPNPYRNRFSVVASQWLDARHEAMGLTGNALFRYYAVDTTRAIKRRIGWEPQTFEINPNEFAMADRGIVAGQLADFAGMYQVYSPYHIVRCLGS
jgi:hypothetical protein